MKKHNFLLHCLQFLFIAGLLIRFTGDAFGIVGPVRRNATDEPALVNCSDIRLMNQHIELYHHPIGIWLLTCTSRFQNQTPRDVDQEFACPAGFDIGMDGGTMYCDEFKNFRVWLNAREISEIRFKEACPNYVERLGVAWTNDDGRGIGYVNTWKVHFKPDQIREVKITFSFVVKSPSIQYNAELHEDWYRQQTDWLKLEYSKRAENDFKLPINLGSFWALYVDKLSIDCYFSNDWLTIEPDESRIIQPEHHQEYNFAEPLGFYSPPVITLRRLTEIDIKTMNKTQLALLRNSFFAKYGRTFEDKILKVYFEAQPWYAPNKYYHNWYLTDYDVQNIKFLHSMEQK